MKPRVNLVTLGVSDLARAREFYEKLGFVASSASQEAVAFFDANGVVLALFNHDALADDAHVEAGEMPAFRGVTLAWNLTSEADVDAAYAVAEKAGARLVKQPQKVFWGGYSGYFADPDGHLWEVAYNPFFPISALGQIDLP